MQSIMLMSLLLVLVGILLAVPSLAKGGRLGGLEVADVHEKEVVSAARFAAVELNRKSNSLFASKLTDIKSAQKQVVQGMKYYLTIEMTQTKCKHNNGPVKDLDSCDTDSKVKQLCTVTVWTFMEVSKLLENSCRKA